MYRIAIFVDVPYVGRGRLSTVEPQASYLSQTEWRALQRSGDDHGMGVGMAWHGLDSHWCLRWGAIIVALLRPGGHIHACAYFSGVAMWLQREWCVCSLHENSLARLISPTCMHSTLQRVVKGMHEYSIRGNTKPYIFSDSTTVLTSGMRDIPRHK